MMRLLLALLLATSAAAFGPPIESCSLGGGVDGGSGDVTAASSLTDNAFVVGDGGSKGVKTISAATARSTLNVEDGATADQAASEFEDGGATPLALENIAGSANTGDFWVGAASGRATPVSSSTAGAGLANLVNPADHAASHTDGTDDIQSATNAQKGLATAAQITALEAIDTETLLLDGTRAMTGNLNMGSQNITSVGTVDGVDFSSHAARHEDGGADEITAENLATSCTSGQVLKGDGAGGLACGTDNTGGGGGGPGPADIDWDLGAMIPAGEASGLPANIDGLAGLASDPTTAPIKVMVFADTDDTGAHRATRVTTDAADFQVKVEGRASSAGSGSVRVCAAWLPFTSYTWQTAVCGGWTAPGNDDDSVSVTLVGSIATWGMAQDEAGLLLLYRDGDGTSGTDDYAADWYGRHLQGRWSP